MMQLSVGAAKAAAKGRAALCSRPCSSCALRPAAPPASARSAAAAPAAALAALRGRSGLQQHGVLLARQLQRALVASSAAGGQAEAAPAAAASVAESEYVVINAFHLVDIAEPGKLVGAARAALEGKEVRGRIYISEQGLNSQFGGRREDVMEFAAWLREQPVFQGIRFNGPDPVEGHAYPRLRLQYKPNLISMAGGMKGVPVTDPAARAEPVSPADWKRMLQEAQALPPEERPVVLDLRNSYEWDAGHFVGAERPLEDNFHETPTEVTDEKVPNYVRDVDPERPVMMYCTGGIRCDVYSAYLKQQGYKKLYTLDKGIQNYFTQEGADMWNGSCYVFDARMAIRPDMLTTDKGLAADTPPDQLPAAAPCQLCGEKAVLPHMNCANVDCNKLFISCDGCKAKYSGCCCPECLEAPRLLRPAKTKGNYGNFSDYVEGNIIPRLSPSRISKRRKRQQALRDKEKAARAERVERRKVAKEAMAQRAQQEGASLDSEREERMARLRELRQKLMTAAA